MGRVTTHIVVALLGVAAGYLIAVVAVLPEEPREPGAGGQAERHAPREPDREAAAADDRGLTGRAHGIEATDEELAFLRRAIDEDRERRRILAEDAAEQARQAPVRPEDDGLAVMDRYLNFAGDVSDVVASYAAMRAHIRTAPGPVRRIASTGGRTAVDLTAAAAAHAVLEFGVGTFVLDRGGTSWNVRGDVVRSLEIRGAGMDRTRLVGPGWAFLCATAKGGFRNLVIRELTIDSLEMEQIVLDARGGIAAALERVRFDG